MFVPGLGKIKNVELHHKSDASSGYHGLPSCPVKPPCLTHSCRPLPALLPTAPEKNTSASKAKTVRNYSLVHSI